MDSSYDNVEAVGVVGAQHDPSFIGAGTPQVFDYLYKAGIVHKARREMLDHMGHAIRAHREVEALVTHCTFTPCLVGSKLYTAKGDAANTKRRPVFERLADRSRLTAGTSSSSAEQPRLRHPGESTPHDGSTEESRIVEWGSPRPAGNPQDQQPGPAAGAKASRRLYADACERERLIEERAQRRRMLEDAYIAQVVQRPIAAIEKMPASASALVDSPPAADTPQLLDHDADAPTPRYMRPVRRPVTANPSIHETASTGGRPPRTRPADQVAWEARRLALEHARPPEDAINAMAERARERRLLRDARTSAAQIAEELATKGSLRRGRDAKLNGTATRRQSRSPSPRAVEPQLPPVVIPKLTLATLV
jgi:hypothetical protein